MTLTELLVVVAIIAVLCGLILPMIPYLRRSASQVKCVGNVRQLGTCFASYAADFRGFVPTQISGSSNDAVKNGNLDLIALFDTYGTSLAVWGCPNIPNVPKIYDKNANTTASIRSNYEYWAGQRDYVGRTICPTRLSSMSPNNVLVSDLLYKRMEDGVFRANHADGGTRWTPFSNNLSLTSLIGGKPRGMSTVFGDLHGRWVPYQDGTSTILLDKYAQGGSTWWYPGPIESAP